MCICTYGDPYSPEPHSSTVGAHKLEQRQHLHVRPAQLSAHHAAQSTQPWSANRTFHRHGT